MFETFFEEISLRNDGLSGISYAFGVDALLWAWQSSVHHLRMCCEWRLQRTLDARLNATMQNHAMLPTRWFGAIVHDDAAARSSKSSPSAL